MPPESRNILLSDNVNNCLVEIIDENDYRSLYFAGNILQSRISLTFPHHLLLSYTQYMMSSLLITPEPARVLLIGIGAGALVSFLHHHFPRCSLDAVDHSDRIIKMAIGYFRMPHTGPIALHCCDGFEFMLKAGSLMPYDLILVDAFDENGMSKTIYTGDFFRECFRSLQPGGVVCCNMWSGNPDELAEVKNLLQKFSKSHLFIPVQNRGNIIVLALNTHIPWQKINRSRDELESLSKRYCFNLAGIVKTTLHHNMTLRHKIGAFFQ